MAECLTVRMLLLSQTGPFGFILKENEQKYRGMSFILPGNADNHSFSWLAELLHMQHIPQGEGSLRPHPLGVAEETACS
jgi:hypothetical protein